MGAPELTGRGFRIRWILAGAAGMAVAASVARPLSYLVGEVVGGILGEVPAEAAIGVVAGGGALGGTALALAGAATAGFATDEALLPGAPPPVPLAFGAAAFVLVHWFLLRAQVPPAGRLAAGIAGGFLVAAVATVGVATVVGFEGGGALFAAIFGALYGAVTLVALSRRGRVSE